MTTGAFWNLENPLKPWGYFDPDGVYDLPFDWASWLAVLVDTYASHAISVAAGLQSVTSSQSAGVITARIQADPVGSLTVGAKYGVTCRITTTNGQVEDQTLYLKVIEK